MCVCVCVCARVRAHVHIGVCMHILFLKTSLLQVGLVVGWSPSGALLSRPCCASSSNCLLSLSWGPSSGPAVSLAGPTGLVEGLGEQKVLTCGVAVQPLGPSGRLESGQSLCGPG